MTQVTLVSLYGDKRPALAAMIGECQKRIAGSLGAAFDPYDVRQIHATIIGFERHIASMLLNANFRKHREQDAVMDFGGYLSYLRGSGLFPFEIQIGGFSKRPYPFVSLNKSPHERSFSIQGDKVVMMGWPIRGEPVSTLPATADSLAQEARIYPATLDAIRHAAQQFGILHGYHRKLTDVDNDCFFRIGMIKDNVPPEKRAGLEEKIREELGRQPLLLEIRLEDIFVAAYEDDRLPLASTRAWPLTDPKVNGEFVAGLFA